MSAAPTLRPLFAFGATGSGVELVVNFLGLHTELEPIYDTAFVADVLRVAAVAKSRGSLADGDEDRVRDAVAAWRGDLYDQASRDVPFRLPFGRSHLTFLRDLDSATETLLAELAEGAAADPYRAVRRFLEDLFAVQARWAQKRSWINASREYVWTLSELICAFPDAILVHVVRDGRDAACEIAREPTEEALLEAGRRWVRELEAALAFETENAARVVRVRFEDVLSSPEHEFSRLCRALGLPDEARKMLAIFANVVPLPEGVENGRDRLPSDDADALERALGPVLKALGYVHDHTAAARGTEGAT